MHIITKHEDISLLRAIMWRLTSLTFSDTHILPSSIPRKIPSFCFSGIPTRDCKGLYPQCIRTYTQVGHPLRSLALSLPVTVPLSEIKPSPEENQGVVVNLFCWPHTCT